MATLFNTKISATYEGLLKTINNAALSATLRELTDGSGNQSGLFLNTAGDFKVTSVLEWGSLKDTGTGVTITQFVTAANGIENFNNDTTLPTSAAVKLYVDTKFSQTDTLTEVLGFGNTTSGKDIAVSANDDITFTDTSKAIFGTGNDLSIFHDSNNSYINETGTGFLFITSGEQIRLGNPVSGEKFARFFNNAQVELFYDNTLRFETTTDGSKVTGDLLVTGNIVSNGAGGSFLPIAGGTMTGNTSHTNSAVSFWGSSNNLVIQHNGTDASIKNTVAGDLVIRNEVDDKDIVFQSDNGSGSVANYILIDGSTGAVELSHYGFKKFETTSSGVTVSGNLTINGGTFAFGNITYYDNVKALFGDSNDLSIYHDGSQSYIDNTASNFNLRTTGSGIFFKNIAGGGNEHYAKFLSDGAVELYYNAVKRLETVIDGAKVTGNLVVTGNITANGGGSFLRLDGGTMTGNTIHNDNVKSIYGTGSDLQIFHDGGNSYISDIGQGDLLINSNGNSIKLRTNNTENAIEAVSNGGVFLYYDSLEKLGTTNTGIAVTGNGAFTGNVTIPNTGELQLGASAGLKAFHDGSLGFIRNSIGDLYLDQLAITKSIFVRVSNANAADTTALTISRNADIITGRNVTIAGDLTVNGTTTTVNSQTLSVVDPLISLATANTANSLDIGFYGKYNDGTARYLGLFNDASDSNKFTLFKGTTVEPTTTVNTSAAGYERADLNVKNLDATDGNFSGVGIGIAAQASRKLSIQNSNADNELEFFGTDFTNIYSRTNSGMTVEVLGTGFAKLGTTGGNLTIANNGSSTFSGNVTISETGANPLVFSKSVYGDFDAENFYRIKFNDVGGTANDVGIGQMDASSMGFNITPSSGASFKFNAGTSGNILELNAAKNATFQGDVEIRSGKKLILQRPNNAVATEISTDSTGAMILDSLNSEGFFFNNNGTNAFKLDHINATFAGTITAAGAVFTGNTETRGTVRTTNTSDNSYFSLFGNNGSLTLDTYGSGAGMQFKILGTTKFTIANSGDATFAGNITVGGSSTFGGDLTIFEAGGNASITLSGGAGNNETYLIQQGVSGVSNGGFSIRNIAEGKDAIVIEDITCNVGIRTSEPRARLEVFREAGVSSIPQLTLGTGESGSEAYSLSTDTIAAGDFCILKGVVNTASAVKMRITSAGDVLISKTALDVGTIGTEFRANGQSLFTANGDNAVDLNRLTNDGAIALFRKDGAVIGSIGSNTAGGQPLLDIAGATGNSNIRFLTTNTERMRITSAGNIGVDRVSPKTKLAVNGSIGGGSFSEDGNATVSASGYSIVGGGFITINQGFVGTSSANGTLVFTYAATTWKSWSLDFTISSTSGMANGVIGGYNNSNSGNTQVFNVNALGIAVTMTNGGAGGYFNIITFSGNFGVHPMVSMKYSQGGNDGHPRADRASLVLTA